MKIEDTRHENPGDLASARRLYNAPRLTVYGGLVSVTQQLLMIKGNVDNVFPGVFKTG
ncbi:MAG: hypothetical protein ACREMA_00420 [Longimicrobiales bacterium]